MGADADKVVKSSKEIAEEKAGKVNTEKESEKKDKKENISTENKDDKNKQSSKEENKKEEKVEEVEYKYKLTFATYIATLGTMGWQALGKLPNPMNGKIEINLLQAKEVIDLLEILDEKTKGNLTSEEDNVLKSTLANLRINYVEEIKKKGGKS